MSFQLTGTLSESTFEVPEVDDGVHPAKVIDLCDPYEEPNQFKDGELQTRFWVDWELDLGDGATEQLRQWINIPDAMLQQPAKLNPKSKLHALMIAFRLIDDDGGFEFDLDSWMGKTASLLIQNKQSKAGDERPYIIDVKPPAARKGSKRTGGLRERLEVD